MRPSLPIIGNPRAKNQARLIYSRMSMTLPSSDHHAQRLAALNRMVLSASGWRSVFGDDEFSLSTGIAPPMRDIVAVAADAYLSSVAARDQTPHSSNIRIVVATDSRPTGPAIADTVLRVCLYRGVEIDWIGVAPTPEVLAYVASSPEIDGFFYVTASHNPPGHNGFKMGFADGAVMAGAHAWPLIERFRTMLTDQEYVDNLVDAVAQVEVHRLKRLDDKARRHRAHAREAYRTLALECSAGRMGRRRFFGEMQRRIDHRPLGIVGELNGSARSTSIDRTLLPELGIATAIYNDTPGTFSHQILPEDAGLTEAGTLLTSHGAQDSSFRVAYVPDNDGDRGNLVFLKDGSAVTLDAQTVFALVVMTELAWTRYLERTHGVEYPSLAVVANGPTSSRIDEICAAFGTHLYRAEVGEANVVALAEVLRGHGMHVVILGEGSNGGNITPPSTVRDPLSTLLAICKLHAFSLFPAGTDTPEVSALPAASTAVVSSSPDGPTDFVAIADSLPQYSTLTTDDPRAKMQIDEVTHADLKRHYERLLPDRLPPIIDRLISEFGGTISWEIYNYEGTEMRRGAGSRTGEQRGGLKVAFYHQESHHPSTADSAVAQELPERERSTPPLAFVWMRGSGTEPVFRILADCRGRNRALLDDLVSWQRNMVADAVVAAQA